MKMVSCQEIIDIKKQYGLFQKLTLGEHEHCCLFFVALNITSMSILIEIQLIVDRILLFNFNELALMKNNIENVLIDTSKCTINFPQKL